MIKKKCEELKKLDEIKKRKEEMRKNGEIEKRIEGEDEKI